MDSTAQAHPADAAPNGNAEGGALAAEVARLRGRVAELERERDQLVAVVDIQREMAGATTVADVLQSITRILARSFSLDRCSVYLAAAPGEARLVASSENPAIRNLVVDLERYPELKRALESGELVFIPDAVRDATLAPARDALALRNVGAIAVVPMRWGGAVIGAIFLRTDRDAREPLSESDLRFCRVVAALTAQALHNARQTKGAPELAAAPPPPGASAAEQRQRALLTFVHRVLERGAAAPGDPPLPAGAAAELDRLVEVALRVIGEEAAR